MVRDPINIDMGKFRIVRFVLTACLAAMPNMAWAAVRTVALSGQSAPDVVAGVAYSGFREFSLNDSGRTAFVATLNGAGVDASNDTGLWSEGLGSLSLVARTGSEAIGAPG